MLHSKCPNTTFLKLKAKLKFMEMFFYFSFMYLFTSTFFVYSWRLSNIHALYFDHINSRAPLQLSPDTLSTSPSQLNVLLSLSFQKIYPS